MRNVHMASQWPELAELFCGFRYNITIEKFDVTVIER